MVPMAHVELLGHGRQTTYARSSVTIPSKRIHVEPGNARNWKNTANSSTPSARTIAATTKVRARLVRNATETPLAQGLALERNLFLKLCVSESALARMRSYEGKKITSPSRGFEV